MARDVGAQPTAGTPTAELTRPALQVERQRLRTELDRVNAEIDTIKRGQRGVRDDYRLRTRLADAEAIARRLTEVETRISRIGGKSDQTSVPVRVGVEPGAAPTDGPAELEAKADILADQSRRLEAQAETLTVRLTQIKGRQELRKRAGQLERDPFAPLEGSKRRAVTGTGATVTAGGGASPAAPKTDRGPAISTETTPSAPAPAAGGTTPTTSPGFGPSALPGNPGAGANNLSGGNRGIPSGSTAPTPTAAGGAAATDASASLSTQLRDVLDAGALAEIRRLEVTGAPGANIAAMERAIAALKARAERLQTQSKALRPK
ncbi:MAG TPA: hypothetical protein VFH73_08415 [Polyangia bacterium]|jgi:hypothetical protein|nr:hypothetical protein [Polyangia bacterium]